MHTVLPKRVLPGRRGDRAAIRAAPALLETIALEPAAVYARLSTRPDGLTSAEAAALLAAHGPNLLARDEAPASRGSCGAR